MVSKESGVNQSETACGLCDVFYARLPWQRMVKLYKGSVFVITETQFAIQGMVSYVTTKLHETSTADATIMLYFQTELFSLFRPSLYAGHVNLAAAKHWRNLAVHAKVGKSSEMGRHC